MWEQVKQSMIFYFSGYFLTTQEGVDSMMAVAKYSAQTEKQVQYISYSLKTICPVIGVLATVPKKRSWSEGIGGGAFRRRDDATVTLNQLNITVTVTVTEL